MPTNYIPRPDSDFAAFAEIAVAHGASWRLATAAAASQFRLMSLFVSFFLRVTCLRGCGGGKGGCACVHVHMCCF